MLIPSFLMSDMSELLRLLTKMSNVSETLRLLTKNEPMGKSLVFLSESLIHSLFAHFFAKNHRFAQKTDERIPIPANCTVRSDTFEFKIGHDGFKIL